MNGRFSAGLFVLEFRRAMYRVLVPTALFLGLVVTLRSRPMASLPFENAAAARGLFREEAWVATLLLLVPLAVFRSARIPRLWRQGEADWIGSRPIGRTTAIVSTWSGLALALFLTLAGAGLWIESRVDGQTEAPLFLGSQPLTNVVRVEPGASRRFGLSEETVARHLDSRGRAPSSVRARVRLAILPGGDPTSSVRLSASGVARSSEALVDGRTWLEVECLLNGEDLELRLENLGGGHVACLALPGVELWRDGGAERDAGLALAMRAAVGLGCATALALALATWIGSVTAAVTVLALWLGLLILPSPPAWLSSTSLPRALGFVAEARLPEALDPRAVLAALVVSAAAWALAVAGLRSWRHAP